MAALKTNLLLSRSPSPEPIYNNEGKRLNTREYRTRKKLEDERHQLVQEAWRHNPNYKPPADYKWGTFFSRHGGHNKSIRLGIAKQMYLCRRKQNQWDCIHIRDVAGWVRVNHRKILLHRRSVGILVIITWNQCDVTMSFFLLSCVLIVAKIVKWWGVRLGKIFQMCMRMTCVKLCYGSDI